MIIIETEAMDAAMNSYGAFKNQFPTDERLAVREAIISYLMNLQAREEYPFNKGPLEKD